MPSYRKKDSADKRCSVQLLFSVLAFDRALHPDGYAGKNRGDTAFVSPSVMTAPFLHPTRACARRRDGREPRQN